MSKRDTPTKLKVGQVYSTEELRELAGPGTEFTYRTEARYVVSEERDPKFGKLPGAGRWLVYQLNQPDFYQLNQPDFARRITKWSWSQFAPAPFTVTKVRASCLSSVAPGPQKIAKVMAVMDEFVRGFRNEGGSK